MTGTGQQLPDIGRAQLQRKAVLAGLLVLLVLAFTVTGPAHPTGALASLMPWLGAACILLCVAGRVWTSTYIGGRKLWELIRTGPYSVCRNPLYALSILGSAGVGMLSRSLVLTLLCAGIVSVVFSVLVRKEEQTLRMIHGEAYEDYLARVPRFLPRLSLWKPGHGTVDRAAVRRTLVDSSYFFLAIPLVQAAAMLRAHHILPTLLLLP